MLMVKVEKLKGSKWDKIGNAPRPGRRAATPIIELDRGPVLVLRMLRYSKYTNIFSGSQSTQEWLRIVRYHCSTMSIGMDLSVCGTRLGASVSL